MTFEGTDASSGLTGQILAGRYRIVAKLGEGAMGAVYVGQHLRIGRRDAIKVLRAGMARDAEATARFIRGARNVSSIRHPNVCTIYDFGDTDDGLQFLAMEYIEGETLKDTLERQGRFELRRAADIAGQVADALQAAHDVGIVHRDLKPGNIMIEKRPDGSERVKVVDFDIAISPADAEGSEVTRLGFVIGTPEYMSPEQLTGDRLDGRSDVYSLGIVLFRMLTGVLPFNAATAQDIMVQRLTKDALRVGDVLPGASFPPALDDLLRRALARQASGRPATASEFARELRAITGFPGSPQPHIVEVPATRVLPAARREPPSASTATDGRPGWLRPRVLVPAAVLVVGIVLVAFVVIREPDDNNQVRADSPSQSAGNATGSTGPANPDAARTSTAPPKTKPGGSQPQTPTTEAINWSAVLLRQFVLLNAKPTRAGLRAVRDTALNAWGAARTRTDSVTAALVAAQAAHELGDFPECLRWAQLGTALGDAQSFKILLDACQQ